MTEEMLAYAIINSYIGVEIIIMFILFEFALFLMKRYSIHDNVIDTKIVHNIKKKKKKHVASHLKA